MTAAPPGKRCKHNIEARRILPNEDFEDDHSFPEEPKPPNWALVCVVLHVFFYRLVFGGSGLIQTFNPNLGMFGFPSD